MRTRIKICCIASLDEAALAIAHGADALGLVGPMPSGPGPIPEAAAAQIASVVPPPVAAFLLTSETKGEAIADHALRVGATAVQAVAHVEPEEWAEVARAAPALRRVQVIHVEGYAALDLIPVYAPHVHAFLLDSGRPSAATPELGGTGRVHDWAVSGAFVERCPRPVILAGGLTPENVAVAIQTVRPFGLDLCTGVRTDGVLDAGKLDRFMRAAAQADAALA